MAFDCSYSLVALAERAAVEKDVQQAALVTSVAAAAVLKD